MRLTFPNLALRDGPRRWVEDHIAPEFLRTRREHTTLHTRWLHFFKIGNVELDQPGYIGRTQVYFPAGRQAKQTILTLLMQSIFPASDWFTVTAQGTNASPERASRWRALQRRFVQHDMQLEHEMELFLDDFLTYGNGWFRLTWEERFEIRRMYEEQLRRAPLDEAAEEVRIRDEPEPPPEEDTLAFPGPSDGTIVRLVEKRVPVKCGPKLRTVSPFHIYVAPFTARSVDEALMVFEDMDLPLDHFERMHGLWMDPADPSFGRVYDHPRWAEIMEARGMLDQEMIAIRSEMLNRIGIDPDPNRAYGDLAKKGHGNLTEAYWRGEIPGATDPTTRQLYGERDWHMTFLNDTWCVRLHPNATYSQRRPWLHGGLYPNGPAFWRQGVFDAIASIQYYLNDVGALTLDNLIMALNPVVVVDQEMVQEVSSLEWAPGGLWFGKPEGFKVLNVQGQTQLGMGMINMLQGMSHDYAGANAAMQGVPPARGRGRVAQTATGYGQMLEMGAAPLQGMVKLLERDILVPILQTDYQLAEQFLTDKQTLQILGADGVTLLTEAVGFEDIFGQYQYEWRGAVGLRERMALLQLLQGLPALLTQMGPAAQQALDVPEFLRVLFRDGLQVPFADRILRLGDDLGSISQDLENDVMAVHRKAEVHPLDDDAMHLQAIADARRRDDRFRRDAIAARLLDEHEAAHRMQQQVKQAQQMEQMMGRMLQGGAGGGEAGAGQAPSPPNLAGLFGEGDAAGTPPGPPPGFNPMENGGLA